MNAVEEDFLKQFDLEEESMAHNCSQVQSSMNQTTTERTTEFDQIVHDMEDQIAEIGAALERENRERRQQTEELLAEISKYSIRLRSALETFK